MGCGQSTAKQQHAKSVRHRHANHRQTKQQQREGNVGLLTEQSMREHNRGEDCFRCNEQPQLQLSYRAAYSSPQASGHHHSGNQRLHAQKGLQNVPEDSLPLPRMDGIGPPAACLYGPFSHGMTPEEALVAERAKWQAPSSRHGSDSGSARQADRRDNQPVEDDAVSDLSSDDRIPGIQRFVSIRPVNFHQQAAQGFNTKR